MKEFVKVQDITKTYKMGEVEIHAVDHISFSIEQGELVVIVGPSGQDTAEMTSDLFFSFIILCRI